MKIYMAPMQGLTDFIYRKVWQQHFTGIDKFFTPFVFYNSEGQFENKHSREILPDNNNVENTIPQILTNNAEDCIKLSELFANWGYKEMNINMGCPFPMVTNKKCGSGILLHYEMIENLFSEIENKLSIPISVKMRLGLNNTSDIDTIIPILNKYSISEIIIHPRYGKQMYKGDLAIDKFAESIAAIKHPVVFNGDILTAKDFDNITSQFSQLKAVMIGRGLVQNPFLINEILKTSECFNSTKFIEFHNNLLLEYQAYFTQGGDKQIVLKMQEKWEYFQAMFPDNSKQVKLIKKATTLNKYTEAVRNLIFD